MSSAFGIQDLAQAIEREENVNPSYNNPGAITSNGSLITFPSLDAGVSALDNQLNRAISGASPYYNPNESLEQFEETYTGGDLNAGSNVASFLGVPSSTPISTFAGSGTLATPTTSGSTTSSSSTTPASTRPFWTYLPGFNELYNFVTGGSTSTASSTGKFIVDGVVVIVGLILIAGAVFGFKSLQTTVVEGVKGGLGAAG